MAIAIVNQWPDTFGDTDGEVIAAPTTGRMLIACIVSCVLDGSAPTLAIGDVSRNGWTLLSDPYQFASVPHVAGQLQVEVWACPSAQYAGWPVQYIYASAMQITASDVGSCAVNVLEVSGTTGQLTVDSVTTGTATASSTLAMTAPAPTGAANVLQIAAAASNIAYGSYTTTGTGWTQLNNLTNTNPELGLMHAWREATTSGAVTFGLLGGALRNWAGVIVALRTAGTTPSQPNPAWPPTSLQIGLGYDLSTPLSRVRWTDQTKRYLAFDGDRGIQAELGSAQQGQATLAIQNHDGAYSPRLVASAATATAAGTTTTIKMADASAANIHKTDFFRITRAPLNANTGFESGTTGWTPTGGTLTTSTTVVQTGTRSGQMTPDGVTATVRVDSTPNAAVTAGTVYTASGWLRCAVARTVSLNVNWFDAGAAYITTTGNDMAVAANTWTFLTADFVAPAGAATGNIIPTMVGTPPATNVLLMDDIVFKVKTELDVFQVTGLASAAGTTTVTFARADGTAGGARAATAAGDVYAGIAIDLYIPWRLQKVVAGITYTVASGWLRDLPLSFADAHYSLVQAQGADAIETLTASNPSALRGEIYRRSPTHYWPLDDSNGVSYAANASGVSNTPLTQTVSKYGAGSATAGFGASTQDIAITGGTESLWGDAGTGWQQAAGVAADLATKGYALVGSDSGFPSISSGVTIVGALIAADLNPILNATADPTVMIVRNADPAAGVGQGSVIKISIDRPTLLPKLTVWDKATHATTAVVGSGAQIATESWRLWAVTFNQTSWSLYLGASLSASGSCNLVASWSGIDVGGEADQFFHGRSFAGVHAHVAVYRRRLTAQEIANMASMVSDGTPPNELSSTRASRKLNTVGYKGTRIINTSVTPDSIEDTPSGTVVDLLSTVASWEDSAVFADAANQLQFRSRVTAYQQRPLAVLGDGAGEIPYQPGQVYDYNPTFLYSQTSVTNTSVVSTNVGSSTLVAIDDTSAAKYPGKTMELATRLQRVSDSWHLGWWLLARYAYPRQRVGTVTVSAAASNDTASSTGRWAFICGVEVGDVLTVNRRPIGQPAISIRCKVLKVSPSYDRRPDPAIAQVTLTLAAEPFVVPVANDTAYGVVGSTVLGV